MARDKLPLYNTDAKDIKTEFPPQMNFILKNYRYLTTSDHSMKAVNIIRERDKIIGKTAIRIARKEEKLDHIQISNHEILLNSTRIPIRIFSHSNWGPNENDRIIIHFHGGGWVYGNLDFYSVSCIRLAHYFDATVISVDYRKAPEYKFPIPFNNCLNFTTWVLDNKSVFGNENTRVYLAGESAGGNLAASVSLYLRDHEIKGVDGQILMYPALDSNLDYGSVQKYGNGHLLTKEALQFFLKAYSKTPADFDNPYFAPLKSKSFKSLMPTLITTASHDVLRDQGYIYYQRLKQDGVPVLYRNYLLTLHGFLNAPNLFYRGEEIYANFINWVRTDFFNLPKIDIE